VRSALRTAHRLRLAAILALGALALHQLRYLIASGGSAEVAHGHGYMTDLLPPIAVLFLAACLATLIRGTEGAPSAKAPLTRRIAVFAATLFVIYAGQEFLEGTLAAGHAGGLAVGFGDGGWVALPLALAIGALAALLGRALEVVERAIAVVHAAPLRARPPAVRGRALPTRGRRLRLKPLAFGLARRPPPAAPA
jgi:hypothetical protein